MMNHDDSAPAVAGHRPLPKGDKLALAVLVILLLVPSSLIWHLREPLREEDPEALNLWARTQENGGWDPGVLVIPANTSVRLRIVSLDVVHGFRIENPNGSHRYPLLDVRPIVSGEPPTVVTLPPLAAGEYTFVCSAPCSQLHTSMRGRLVVR